MTETTPQKLLRTVGLPRSGKSTWAKSTGYPIVNPDSIRLAIHGQAFFAPAEALVWAFAHLMVRALFDAGHRTVILDATNVTARRRDEWTKDASVVEDVVFMTTPVECIQRAHEGGRDDLIPVIHRMAKDADFLTDEQRKKWLFGYDPSYTGRDQ